MIEERHYFKLHMGATIKSLEELFHVLREMDEITFSHHVTSTKNDFANWVEHVFKNRPLAERLRECKSKPAMIHTIHLELHNKQHEFKAVNIKNHEDVKQAHSQKVSHVDDLDEELRKINERLENIALKEFSIQNKTQKIEKLDEKIEKEVEHGLGMREFLYGLLGLSIGIIFMVVLRFYNII